MTSAALPTLRTPRLELRPLAHDDRDALIAGVGNYDVARWLSVVPYPYRPEHAEAFLRDVVGTGSRTWAITDAHGLQGVVSTADEFGYWLARTAWGKGYGFEAAQAAVSHWFEMPGAPDLVTHFYPGNDRSGRILAALGFEPDGVETRHALALSQALPSNRMRLTGEVWLARRSLVLRSERLTLRPMNEADAPALVRLAVPEVVRNLSTLRAGIGVEEARRYIAARRWRGVPGFILAVEVKKKVIGALALGGVPVQVAYFLHPDAWGQRYATEALRTALPAFFDRFPLSRIEADVFADNLASRNVLTRRGFEPAGESAETSPGRLEPSPVITYAVSRDRLRAAP